MTRQLTPTRPSTDSQPTRPGRRRTGVAAELAALVAFVAAATGLLWLASTPLVGLASLAAVAVAAHAVRHALAAVPWRRARRVGAKLTAVVR